MYFTIRAQNHMQALHIKVYPLKAMPVHISEYCPTYFSYNTDTFVLHKC